MLRRLSRPITRRSAKRALLTCAVAVGLLSLIGTPVDRQTRAATVVVPGTPYARALELSDRHFGSAAEYVILLRGPAASVERNGRRLVAAFRLDPRARAVSPWDRAGGLRQLRPRPGTALVLVNYADRNHDFTPTVSKVKAIVARSVSKPVTAHLSGASVFAGELRDASLNAVKQAEVIALPVLLLVLLLVFRSPVAALLPLVVGAATIGTGRGVLSLLTNFMVLDPSALTIASSMGLALGVDYALVLVSRHREETARANDPFRAATIARGTAGRAVLFAGMALNLTMLVAALAVPGQLLTSLTVGVLVSGLISIAIALSAIPPLLALLGPRVDRWAIGGSVTRRSRVLGPALRAMRRPAMVGPIVLLGLLLLSASALGLRTGPPDVHELPPHARARQASDLIQSTMRGAWTAPYELVVASKSGPITNRTQLDRLATVQRRIQQDPDVSVVLGPALLEAQSARLDRTSGQLASSGKQLGGERKKLRALANGLGQAADGVSQLRSGLVSGGAAAGMLSTGAGRLQSGLTQLRSALSRAESGGRRLTGGINRARTGAARLHDGIRRASSGAARLSTALASGKRSAQVAGSKLATLAARLKSGASQLSELRTPVGVANDQLSKTIHALEGMSVGKADPRYLAALDSAYRASGALTGRDPRTGRRVQAGYDGVDAALRSAAAQLMGVAAATRRDSAQVHGQIASFERLVAGSRQLVRGLDRLASGTGQFSGALPRLSQGGRALTGGLGRVRGGAGALGTGAGQLGVGSATLSQRLASGATDSQPLQSGLQRAKPRVAGFDSGLKRQSSDLTTLHSRSPDFFRSGYALLAAVDGASRATRASVGGVVSVERGGQAARILVIPRAGAGADAGTTKRLGGRLERTAQQLGRAPNTEAGLVGSAAEFRTFDSVTASQFPLLVVTLLLVTWLLLVIVFRALLLPLIAVALNLITVAAAFAVLTVLYVIPGHPLQGAGFVDAVTAASIFAIVFGLSMDYQVFLLTRIRESWLASGDPSEAIRHGLVTTTTVITGGALTMIGVFVALATSDLATLRQLGIGLSVAIAIDAVPVRLFLLPAILRACGARAWWMPAWLDRRLPRLDPEPT